MNTEMTKAILDGRKTQTRRVIKLDFSEHMEECINPNIEKLFDGDFGCPTCGAYHADGSLKPKYQKDEVIWVREPAIVSSINNNCDGKLVFEYLADDGLKPADTRYAVNLYSIDMPNRFLDKNGTVNRKWINLQQGIPNGCVKEMARIFLEITDIRVERLQNISHEDIMAEGCVTYNDGEEKSVSYSAYNWYKELWNKTALKGYKWKDNPYVFVYEFERVNKDGDLL